LNSALHESLPTRVLVIDAHLLEKLKSELNAARTLAGNDDALAA
jgi:hypothetical protein